ncbi:hypothetical protein ACFLWA_12065 [Chloroflexota bacterium]
MTNNEMIAQVQALHTMVMNRYEFNRWCEESTENRGAQQKLLIMTKGIFGNDSEGRELRLASTTAVLPLLQFKNRSYKPITIDSYNDLWLAEVFALIDWLDENGKAETAMERIKDAPHVWSARLRKHLGFIERPIIVRSEDAAQESPLENWATAQSHAGQQVAADLPF